jgi:hypothetical protein
MAIIETAEKKLEEVRTFLADMRDQEQKAFGDKQPFDHYLSAFLNAGMSLRGAFHVQEDRGRNEAVKKWKEAWEAQLTSAQKSVYDFMREDRRREVHDRGSQRVVETKEIKIPVGGTYSDKSGTVAAMGSPSVLLGADTGVTIYAPQYFFDISGEKRPVTEVCAEYLDLLEQMVAHYKANASN